MANVFPLYRVNTEPVGVDGRGIGTLTYEKSAGLWKSPLTTTVGTVIVGLKKMSSPTDGVVCKIYSDDSTSPQTLLGTSDTISNTALTTSLVNNTFTFDPPISVVQDTFYWVVFERTGSLDNTNYYRCGYQGSFNLWRSIESRYLDDGVWVSYGTNTALSFSVYATSDPYKSIHEINQSYTTYFAWSTSSTNWGVAHPFVTPASAGSFRLKCIMAGWGGTANYGYTSGDYNVYCEIHEYCDPNTQQLDFTSYTTRVGGRSDGFPRFQGAESSYTTSHLRYFRWSDPDDEPNLQPNTPYWLIILPGSYAADGDLRIGRKSGDPLGDGYDTWRIKSDGDFQFTTDGYVLNNVCLISWELSSLAADTTAVWTIVEQDYWPIGNDFVILNHIFATHLDSDFVTRWGILLAEDTILKYGLISVPAQDFVLKWKVLNEAQWDTIFRWGIIVANEYIFPWTLRHLRASDVVLPMPIVMATDVDLLWGINTRLYQDHIFRWFIESKIWRDIALRYHIKVETDHILLIPLLTPIEQDHVLSYHLTQPIGSDTTIRFKIRDFNQVDADNKLRWVLSGRPRIYKIKFE